MKTNLWIHGISGRMGVELCALAEQMPEVRLLGGDRQAFNSSSLDRVDDIIDFSSASGNEMLLREVRSGPITDKRVLIGTTGLSASLVGEWKATAVSNHLAVLFAPNTSLGVQFMHRALSAVSGQASRMDFDIELQESHHRGKKDAPSGTAKALLETICAQEQTLHPRVRGDSARLSADEVGVQVVRGGGVFGEHTVRFIGEHEELVIQHRAFSRALFAKGAMQLLLWLQKQPLGAVYEMSEVTLES